MTDKYDENLEYSLKDLTNEILKEYHVAPNCYYEHVKRRLSNSSQKDANCFHETTSDLC